MAEEQDKIHRLQAKLKEAADLFLSMDCVGGGIDTGSARQSKDAHEEVGASGIPGADALMQWMQNKPPAQLAPVEGEDLATALLTAMAALEAFEGAVAAGRESRQSISGEWFVANARSDP